MVVSAARRAGIKLKQTYAQEGKTLRRWAGDNAHAKQFKRLRAVLKRQCTIFGVVLAPAIGYTKADHRMDRCWMKGALGDALHA